jgi:phosphate transport system protein
MKHLRRDLDRIEKHILEVGSLVEGAIRKATVALVDRRSDLAEEVIQGDALIDAREVEVEEEILKCLALHQPVAIDLRFLVAVLKVNNDLERMGDLAMNVAERSLYLSSHEPLGVHLDFKRMVDLVRGMVSGCLDALVQQDSLHARALCKLDDQVDAMNKEMFVVLERHMLEHPESIERAVHALSASRHLERIADLATNIAEDVVFMVEGDVIRHRAEDYCQSEEAERLPA